MKIMTVFIDTSAWIAIVDKDQRYHDSAQEYFKHLLEKNAKIITNNIVIDEAITWLKENKGSEVASSFLSIIDESVITINLRVDWISRRVRKLSLNQYLKSKDTMLQLSDNYKLETLRRKNADLVFTYNDSFRGFGFPVMPQKS
jgi:predicted nucleic acid-binding protein